MRIKLGSVAYLRAANSGYGIGLDHEGHRVEFLGDRHVLALATLGEPIDVEDWQVLAVDEELRLPLTRLAMAQRTAFIRAALADAAENACRALGCENRRVRAGATHCKVHEVEWHAIEADQRALLARGSPIRPKEIADLKARRFAMNMVWPPRTFKERAV
jgi:hypothetical protein